MAQGMTLKQRREQRRQELQEAIGATEARMEDIVWRHIASVEAAELQRRDFSMAEANAQDQDATTWWCLSLRRADLRMELETTR